VNGRRIILCVVLFAAFTGVADAKEYSAERFDARIEVLRGGTLHVTERVLVRFEDGTFRQFYREIPSRLTDGLEVVSASMDDTVFPEGDGPGQVEIRRSSRTRVTWRFPRLSGCRGSMRIASTRARSTSTCRPCRAPRRRWSCAGSVRRRSPLKARR
jgi:hypothetical protein